MEITIDNAFSTAVLLSLRPFVNSYRTAMAKIEKWIYAAVHIMLDKPSLSITIILPIFGAVAVFILISFTIVGGVFCFMASILLLEGFIIITSFLIICIMLLLVGIVLIIIIGVVSMK